MFKTKTSIFNIISRVRSTTQRLREMPTSEHLFRHELEIVRTFAATLSKLDFDSERVSCIVEICNVLVKYITGVSVDFSSLSIRSMMQGYAALMVTDNTNSHSYPIGKVMVITRYRYGISVKGDEGNCLGTSDFRLATDAEITQYFLGLNWIGAIRNFHYFDKNL